MKKFPFALGLGALLCLGACTGQQPQTSSKPASIEEGEKPVNVFILSGQSNMEGNTQFDDGHGYLAEGLEELGITDAQCCYDGIPEVQTSFYGGPAFNMNNTRGSNKEDKMAGLFLDTVLGMGADEKQFGPEVGAAYVLKDHASEEAPIYFIKSAFGGSGLGAGGFGQSWDLTADTNLYKDHLKVFVENNLKLIEKKEGRKPTIKGFLWHQGENDAQRSASSKYKERFDRLLGQFRDDFSEYAPEEDGNKIALIDCYIFDKGDSDSASLPSGVTVGDIKFLNEAKTEISEESDMNFIINSSWQIEGGLKLQVNENSSGVDHGGVGGQHYWAKDMFQLGMEYAKIIVENDLLK